MSVEKLSNDSRVEKEKIPFTQICNDVIHNIKNGDAFLVWCYMQSKTQTWKVIKQNIKNVYGFGDKKLKAIFSYLNRANLIKYTQTTCANGRFARMDIQVLCGSKFDNNQRYNECATAGPKTARAVNGTSGNDELLNIDITKQRKELKKEKKKILSASNDARAQNDPSLFNKFWESYPKKKDKIRAQEIWKKRKYDEIATLILNDVKNRTLNEASWQTEQYIPNPSTYLKNQRWTDEVTLQKVDPKKVHPVTAVINELKQDYMKMTPEEKIAFERFMN